jgi:hypothetical protein
MWLLLVVVVMQTLPGEAAAEAASLELDYRTVVLKVRSLF